MKSSCAPGKIILFGEHAVVYGRPALAVPVLEVQACAQVAQGTSGGIRISSAEVGLDADLNALPADHPLAAVVHNLLFSLGVTPFPALDIHITSTIPVASGLGSGAAVSVALVRALSEYLGHPLSDELVNAFAFEIEKLHHGSPSGIDNTVITYARPVYFIKGLAPERLAVEKPFTLVIGDTGIPAPTKESVAGLRRLWESDRGRWEAVFDEVGSIVEQAREETKSGRPGNMGGLMDRNHRLLQEMTVSSPELDGLVEAARAAGALGAKMSGGGRGGNMIALAGAEQAGAVAEALRRAGAKRVIVSTVMP